MHEFTGSSSQHVKAFITFFELFHGIEQNATTSDASRVTQLTNMLINIKSVFVFSLFDATIFDISGIKPFIFFQGKLI